MKFDPVKYPKYYNQYPVQPIEISRHIGFCLGNALKYVLRAPFKGGVEDCDKALQYLTWEKETPYKVSEDAYRKIETPLFTLAGVLAYKAVSDDADNEIRLTQASFLRDLSQYTVRDEIDALPRMRTAVSHLRRLLEEVRRLPIVISMDTSALESSLSGIFQTAVIPSPKSIHKNAVDHGWYEGQTLETIGPDFIPSKLALCHSELSEALEDYRKYGCQMPGNETEPGKGGFTEEMADTVIRIFDICAFLGLDIVGAINRKHQYNKNRPYRHGNKVA